MTALKTIHPIPEFPLQGILPKEETEAASFLKKYPNYDGRNTIIAILDTGVDPGAAGLQVTSDGKPKIIDIVDCSGSGDVPTTTIVKPTEEDGVPVITGLTGRKLRLSKDWKNPTGEYRIGIKRAFNLFPVELTDRIKKERLAEFQKKHFLLVAKIQDELAAFLESHPTLTEEEQRTKADFNARLEALKDSLKNYSDPGPVYDCVVFHDGEVWRAVIDTNEDGDLRDAPVLTDYKIERQYATFSNQDKCNYSVNIYDSGNMLCIVVIAGSHGTHVAAITAANHPDEPALNGVAPGAQIVSIKIGDSRLGSIETHHALTRAVKVIIDDKCDLANMSYGEAASYPNIGRFVELIREEAVGRHGCIFVSSAGNAGPALSTVGAPGGTSSGFVGVGAYQSHAMQQAEYALFESVPERPYTWSSRGPTFDGDVGVSIYAPGAAITSIPEYELSRFQRMNGTSMSSPNACGCIALILSGLKGEKKSYTPYRVHRALVNTAKDIQDQFRVGFLQVEKSFTHLLTYHDYEEQDVDYDIQIVERDNARGVYLREWEECNKAHTLTVKVEPKFMKDIDYNKPDINEKKLAFECRIALVPTESWVRVPEFLFLNGAQRQFEIKVDPTQLTAGSVHFAEIQAFDSSCPARGPVFSIYVTVAKPMGLTTQSYIKFENIQFGPGHIERRLIYVPAGATHADVIIRSSSGVHVPQHAAKFVVYAAQSVPHLRNDYTKQGYMIRLGKGSYAEAGAEEQSEMKRFSVYSGRTLELCLAQYWDSPGAHSVTVELTFHGLQLSGSTSGPRTVFINGADHITRFHVTAPIRREEGLSASISLDTLRKSIRPSESTIKPLVRDRDSLPNSRLMYNLITTYPFKVEASGKETVTVTPRFPSLNDLLYDSPLEVLIIVSDLNNKVVGYGDVYVKRFKLPKGEYNLRLQIRHESEEILEKYRHLPGIFDFSLTKAQTLEVSGHWPDALAGKKNAFPSVVERGDTRPAFVISSSEHPKGAKPGDFLVGEWKWGIPKVDGPPLSRVVYAIPPEQIPIKEETVELEEEVDVSQQLADQVRDAQIAWLKKSGTAYKTDKDKEAAAATRKKLIAQIEAAGHGKHLPFLLAQLDVALALAENANEAQKEERWREVLATASKITGAIDEAALAQYFGLKQVTLHGKAEAEQKKIKKEKEETKNALVAALKARCLALVALKQDSDEAYNHLSQWSEGTGVTDWKTVGVYLERERKHGNFGLALQRVNSWLSEQGSGTRESVGNIKAAISTRRELLRELGWSVWEEYELSWDGIRLPKAPATF
ncbi:tripeptidyl-peptidase II Tpp2 [Lobosporangium transversale]|uniref:tripeptidyl-peptidase II n=1 Tax=Lobosporangium transversale TaxID=64571 RepID=A0A1Y2GAH1_9FUNG|nr:subtilase family-domain-containing protein [Lobosporangium transversale]KAF9901893.1 tripeptidyl-peptidase II Tpp2 [Lobosporangium transversale]ORZ05565.1 subtilase family-domain-containing protein [Lobosporangium transversale]|eukprot:XP_021877139.1 subtilase family-domain-containing protein [Lobosporangium transversale]